jgi:nitrogen fixation-related uncharacterized protein
MIVPSALNVLIIFASVIIANFLWRMAAARFADNRFGQAMAAVM